MQKLRPSQAVPVARGWKIKIYLLIRLATENIKCREGREAFLRLIHPPPLKIPCGKEVFIWWDV